MPSHQRQTAEQSKVKYSPLGKAFGKQIKMIEEQGRKQIDAIANQNKRSVTLINKDCHKDNYKEIFEKVVKERFDEIKELTDEISQNDLTYYFKGKTARKRFDDFNNGIENLKIKNFCEMKLEEADNMHNVFRSNQSKISRGRYNSEEQKSAVENIKFLCESWKADIKLFNDYSSIVSEAKYKAINGKGILSQHVHFVVSLL